MAETVPDLTRTITDWQTGEVVFQGNEGPEVEKYRAIEAENMKKWNDRRRNERLAAQEAAKTDSSTEEIAADEHNS